MDRKARRRRLLSSFGFACALIALICGPLTLISVGFTLWPLITGAVLIALICLAIVAGLTYAIYRDDTLHDTRKS